MTQAYRVAPRPLTSREKPIRSQQYLAFIRRQPSVVSSLGPCEACHTGGHGRSQKSSDLDCIPLTRREHKALDADPQGFAALHGLDIPAVIQELRQKYLVEELCLPESTVRRPM